VIPIHIDMHTHMYLSLQIYTSVYRCHMCEREELADGVVP